MRVQLSSGMKLLLVFAAVLVVAAATNIGFLPNLLHGTKGNRHDDNHVHRTKDGGERAHYPARTKDSSNTKYGNKYDNRPPHTKEPGTRHNTKDGAGHGLFPHIIKGIERVLSPHGKHDDKSRSKPAKVTQRPQATQPPIYCSKPVPPQYGEIEENYDVCEINSIIHYSCQNGYVLYGSSLNKCVNKDGRAVWAYSLPVCRKTGY